MRGHGSCTHKMDQVRRWFLFVWSQLESYYKRRRRRTRGSLRLTSIHPLFCNRDAPYKCAIQQLALHHLASESTTTTDDKIEAIASIGHLCWTGGIEASQYTGRKYMYILVFMLQEPYTPDELKLIIKSLSELCCGVQSNQDLAREHQLIPVIVEYMSDMEGDEETRKWCLHTLFYLLCNNRENQKQALEIPDFEMCILHGMDDDWEAWGHNEARELQIVTSASVKSSTHESSTHEIH